MKTGRPLEFNPEEAVQAATILFWEKGYEGTSTNELMKAMNLSKSSLYQSFGSKEKLFTTCVNKYGEMASRYMEKLYASTDSVKAFIEILFRSIIDDMKARSENKMKGMPAGCFIVNSTCELDHSSHHREELVHSKSNHTRAFLKRIIQTAIDSGEISSDHNAEDLATFIFTNLCGFRVMEKMTFKEEHLHKTVDHILSVIES